MENGPFIDYFPIKTTIYRGFSMAMLNNQMVVVSHESPTTYDVHIHLPPPKMASNGRPFDKVTFLTVAVPTLGASGSQPVGTLPSGCVLASSVWDPQSVL